MGPQRGVGGCPQVSILGVFLFNVTVDDLEEGCQDVSRSLTGVQEPSGSAKSDREDESPQKDEPVMMPVTSTPSRHSQDAAAPFEDSPVCPGFLRRSRKQRRPRRLDIPLR